jgi:hypothetical protein
MGEQLQMTRGIDSETEIDGRRQAASYTLLPGQTDRTTIIQMDAGKQIGKECAPRKTEQLGSNGIAEETPATQVVAPTTQCSFDRWSPSR